MKRRFSFLFILTLIALIFFFILRDSPRPPFAALTPLGENPQWEQLEKFQNSITKTEFQNLLEKVYTQDQIYQKYIKIFPTHAMIHTNSSDMQKSFRLNFSQEKNTKQNSNSRSSFGYWRKNPIQNSNPQLPLKGLRIAIDPGHIGGNYAKIEERWFQVDKTPPIKEGELTLTVAKILAEKLQDKGAEVFLVRTQTAPVTQVKPESFREVAQKWFNDRGRKNITETYRDPHDPDRGNSLQWRQEVLTYRNQEIRDRAKLINEKIMPDITLCIHFDAEYWGNPNNPILSNKNYTHVIINGSYMPEELHYNDVRFEMLFKLLSRTHSIEKKLGHTIAKSLAASTQLPATNYYLAGHQAKAMSKDSYLWARNLLANRLYQNPVIFLEAFVMNNPEVIARIHQGDYKGFKKVYGKMRKSIFREYADGIVNGLIKYYSDS
ncbi:MAG: N-acetylmuramoyl-L-alanine amidase [Deltaproteobacteria bacterium]|nr:N-acetylmuramoyl-L-alanine amidase [Deltaproteobacteria bacterium]